jgi:hypothetical protein
MKLRCSWIPYTQDSSSSLRFFFFWYCNVRRKKRRSVMADIIFPAAPPSIPCRFENAWIGKCEKPTDTGLCTEHEGLVCCVCGKQAERTCDYTGSSPRGCYVLLCGTCEHEPYHPTDAPFPSMHLSAADFKEALRRAEAAQIEATS